MDKVKCDKCGELLNQRDIVVCYDFPKPGANIICSDCSNESMMELLGLGCSKADFIKKEVSFKDYDEKERYFKVRTYLVTDDLFILGAGEIKEEEEGYEFQVKGEFSITDHKKRDELFDRLCSKIQKGISSKYLDTDEFWVKSGYNVTGNKLQGRFARPKKGKRQPYVVIDGEEYSWSEFGRLLIGHSGEEFRMELNFNDED